jgi:methionine-rich copper-binding protein CopC
MAGRAEPGRPAPARSVRVVLCLVVVALAALGPVPLAPAASAHATMAASWPANGQVLTVAPDHVLVEFTTAVSPDAVIAIVDPTGTSVTVGQPTIDGRFLRQRIRPTGGTGTYVAGIHVIAADLHPIVTRLEFTVDPAGAATANPAGAEPDLTPARVATARAETADNHLRAVFPGVLIVVLAGLVALVLRRQSRTRPA